jgi:YD repeat-containing protein
LRLRNANIIADTEFIGHSLGEQREAIDDKGDKTISTYDRLGRRITRVHPDAGLSTYAYDLAANLTSLQTANLQIGSSHQKKGISNVPSQYSGAHPDARCADFSGSVSPNGRLTKLSTVA